MTFSILKQPVAFLATSILSISFLFPSTASADGEVNLYSARKEKLIKPLLDKFTTETGIKVNFVTAKADALLKRLEAEGALSGR